ncbi:FG-GAP repeat domain-containing protein [Dyella acidiphila]|uniref:VCBS repeat-containing protein n=1 Tax=Dyella acidiphila TaxID=2775866 RepID=A0ABR9GE24_9GAMM|nr:VCBS repeat-containing protein [Dyella acidiphila]MBE1162261.1 VCBS repeat-containing protein [Dyella acidiphila]
MRSYRWLAVAGFVMAGFVSAMAQAQTVSFNNLPALRVTTPVPSGLHVPGDADGNGVSDIFLFNTSSSQVSYWLMDTNDATGAVTKLDTYTYSVTPGYFVGAIGDFNGDGLADMVLTSSNRDLVLWTNNGSGGFTTSSLGTYDSGWILVGAGDVNGDGQDDLLWLNPTTCQFSYWTIQNGVKVNAVTTSITCGYYPISIGYYTPSNRLSIIWTSAAQDLQIWDSAGNQFTPYSLGTFGPGSTLIALGGGYEGSQTSLIYTNSSTVAFGLELDRYFNSSGQQTSWQPVDWWADDSYTLPWSSAGFLIEGRGSNMTGMIYQHGATKIEVCPPLGGAGYESTPAPMPNTCPSFAIPSGWRVIGATANGIVPH